MMASYSLSRLGIYGQNKRFADTVVQIICRITGGVVSRVAVVPHKHGKKKTAGFRQSGCAAYGEIVSLSG
jgi:hypothetical protein